MREYQTTTNMKPMNMNTKNLSYVLLSLLALDSLVALFADIFLEKDLSPWIEIIALITTILIFIILIFDVNFRLQLRTNKDNPHKEKCRYKTSRDCPYVDIKTCPYETNECKKRQRKRKSPRPFILVALLVISLVFSILNIVLNKNNNYAILEIAAPIASSMLAAILTAYLIDMPGRMNEYQDYFVELLSSNEYLKQLSDEDLSNLREHITTLQHEKDFPNMPKGLIKLDEQIFQMLRNPYFKDYTQIVSLEKETDQSNTIIKKGTIEYTAHNPGRKDYPVTMNIGMSNDVMFPDSSITDGKTMAESAKGIFKINKFVISFDTDDDYIDLRPYISVVTDKVQENELAYNGTIHLAPLKENGYSNIDKPFTKANFKERKKFEKLEYRHNDEEQHVDLFVKFRDKIKIRLEYQTEIPIDDICFTKRLRYPVKHFLLDYSLGQNMSEYSLTGQILGTLIDQPDITRNLSADKHKITLKTQNWLLPKNGVYVVHYKKNKKI